MKRLLQTIYYYTRTERIGIVYLCSLALFILCLPKLYPWLSPQKAYDFTDFQRQLAEISLPEAPTTRKLSLRPFNPNTLTQEDWENLGLKTRLAQTIINFRNKGGQFRKKEDLQKIYGLSRATYDSLEPYIQIQPKTILTKYSSPTEEKPINRFPFDPNTVSLEELAQLGVPSKVAKTWDNFRQKGGFFKQKDDIQKIYGLTKEVYQELLPFISLAELSSVDSSVVALESGIPPASAIPSSYEPVAIAIDINQSKSEDWEQLKGIGPAYARRILGFREKLGGFISIDQVAETYHLPDSTFQAIRPFLRSSPIRQPILINQVEAKALQAHPYLNWKQAHAIVNYRHQHGNFSQLDDLRSLHALSQETIDKIAPYLSFETTPKQQ